MQTSKPRNESHFTILYCDTVKLFLLDMPNKEQLLSAYMLYVDFTHAHSLASEREFCSCPFLGITICLPIKLFLSHQLPEYPHYCKRGQDSHIVTILNKQKYYFWL